MTVNELNDLIDHMAKLARKLEADSQESEKQRDEARQHEREAQSKVVNLEFEKNELQAKVAFLEKGQADGADATRVALEMKIRDLEESLHLHRQENIELSRRIRNLLDSQKNLAEEIDRLRIQNVPTPVDLPSGHEPTVISTPTAVIEPRQTTSPLTGVITEYLTRKNATDWATWQDKNHGWAETVLRDFAESLRIDVQTAIRLEMK